MVNGNEYVFPNVEEAMKYILDVESKELAADVERQNPPVMYKPKANPFLYPNVPIETITPNDIRYPLSAYFNDADKDEFIMVRLQSGRYSLKPNLKERRFLFRGETEFHSRCSPNLFRNVKQTHFIEEMMIGHEMFLLILSHPLVQLLDTGIEIDGQIIRFEMNLWGLCQHYFNKTTLLDLTSDPEVAMFFATCNYDWNTDTYFPIVEGHDEPGVIYFYTLNIHEDFKPQLNGKNSSLTTIGLQVFPRSGSQKGFLCSVEKGQNFNDLCRLRAFRFKHNGNKAREIFEKFNEGELLFPDDILSTHWKKYNRNSKVLSNRAVRLNQLFNDGKTTEQLTREITDLGYEIKDYIPSFTTEELNAYYADAKTKYWPQFCSQIHIPGDDGTMMQALLNVPNDSRYSWAFESGHNHTVNPKEGYIVNMYQSCLR